MRTAIAETVRQVRLLPSQVDSLRESIGGRIDLNHITMEMWYRLITTNGIIPALWSIATGKEAPTMLVSFDLGDLLQTSNFKKFQLMLAEWDSTLDEDETFSHERFNEMRMTFANDCDQLAGKFAATRAAAEHIGRNDVCFCGSGRKYKKCCAWKGFDEVAGR